MRLATCSWLLIFAFIFSGCADSNPKNVPVIGYVSGFEDNTIDAARIGFIDALKAKGYSDSAGTVKIIYRNAQGSIPTVTQIVQYFISQNVVAIATNPSIPTIAALQQTKTIPVFMMVSPEPSLMHLGNTPKNLLGVGDDLAYIDTSFLLMRNVLLQQGKPLKVGVLYNQSEPQSVTSLELIQELSKKYQVQLEVASVSSSAEISLVTQQLLSKNISAFFANPDNIVFAGFESIAQACKQKQVPIFTSEAGLVQRGAVAAYGADMYQWGYQAGEQAAQYLNKKVLSDFSWQKVKVHTSVYNTAVAKEMGIQFPSTFKAL